MPNQKLFLETRYPELLGPGTTHHETREIYFGDGYRDIVIRLLDDLKCIDHGFNDIEICQIASDLGGGLEVNGRGFSRPQMRRVNETEKESKSICEDCGQPGTSVDLGFCHKVLCRKHSKKQPMRNIEFGVPLHFINILKESFDVNSDELSEFVVDVVRQHVEEFIIVNRSEKGTDVLWGEGLRRDS